MRCWRRMANSGRDRKMKESWNARGSASQVVWPMNIQGHFP
jgi:hypothetical protein